MSVYGYFACEQCRVYLWLGKALFRDDRTVEAFAVGGIGESPNSDQPLRTRALWKMLADHWGHPMRTLLEHEFDFVLGDTAVEIGGAERGDISFEEYLRDWTG